jgi:hypothetical protein
MNIDSDVAQMTIADCIHLSKKQNELADEVDGTQTYMSNLDNSFAISYNPNLDFYTGTSTPIVNTDDVTYCINYVSKKWRFVYNTSLTCSPEGAVVSVDIAGGKVGNYDQAEFYVDAPAEGTVVGAEVSIDCDTPIQTTISLSAKGNSDTTSPFEATIISE